MDNKILSVIDANINRALEGLRVCEDYLRFNTRSGILAQKIKDLRHQIKKESSAFPKELLLLSRDVAGDQTKFIDNDSEKKRNSGMDIFSANIHRAIEAVRSIEEFSKLLGVFPGSNPFQEIRFLLYDLEKDIFTALSKEFVLQRFKQSLYALLDSSFILNNEYCSVAKKMLDGGAGILQLRMKGEDKGNVLSVAKDLASLCKEAQAVFIVNDHVDIASLADAHGVHLGQNDIPVREARKLMSDNAIIGISTHSLAEFHMAQEFRPDYIALGPVYDTTTKTGDLLEGIGFDVISQIRKDTHVPLVAIGGVQVEHVKDVIANGYDSVAVISALYKDNDYKGNCQRFVQELELKNVYHEEHEDHEERE